MNGEARERRAEASGASEAGPSAEGTGLLPSAEEPGTGLLPSAEAPGASVPSSAEAPGAGVPSSAEAPGAGVPSSVEGAGAPRAMGLRGRLLVLTAAVTVLACLAGAAVWRASDRADRKNHVQAGGPAVSAGTVSLAPGGGRRVVFRSMAWGPHRDELAVAPAAAPGGPRVASGVTCLRFSAAGGTGICLQAKRGAVSDTYDAVVLDSRLRATRRVPLAGIPTRARVSPSGHLAAWTVFVGGDSYAGSAFSTRTSILDVRTGKLQATLEDYAVTRDGHRLHAADANFWGVTFADDQHFYATLATGGHTYLIHGDIAARTATTVLGNVECPSLSPDGTRIAFKKRVPGLPADAPWRLYVLDLATLRQWPLAEPRSVDDQAVWSDDHTVVYAMPGDFGSDLYTVPADGSGAARRLATAALAPSWLS